MSWNGVKFLMDCHIGWSCTKMRCDTMRKDIAKAKLRKYLAKMKLDDYRIGIWTLLLEYKSKSVRIEQDSLYSILSRF